MKPAYWSMIGLVLDIVGAFFLSVEAMGLANFRSLRLKILQPIHKATLPIPIHFVEPGEELPKLPEPTFRESALESFKTSFSICNHCVGGFLILLGVNWISHGLLLDLGTRGSTWVLSLRWWIKYPFGLWLCLVAIWVLFSLGEIIHQTLTKTSLLFVRFVEFIEDKTTTGAVGLIGFALLLLGFLLQLYGTFKGITP